MTDYSTIFLSQRDRSILKSTSSGAVIKLHPVDAEHLISLDFIAPYALTKTGDEYVITNEGLLFQEFLDKQESLMRKDEQEYELRIQENRTWQMVSFTIGVLTLVATVIFGILGLLR